MKKKIGLIDYDGKIPNLALMKYSSYFKKRGHEVYLNDNIPSNPDMVFVSVLFSWNRKEAMKLQKIYDDIYFGGPGWDLDTTLPKEVQQCSPDYELYNVEDVYPRIKGIMKKETRLKKAKIATTMGIGFTSRGCIRDCGFCIVPEKEGKFRQASAIKDIINPESDVITLLDNNFTADPNILEKLKEIKERNLTIDISQGIDIRLITPKKAKALSEVNHLRSIHYAWDLVENEEKILQGIDILSQHIKTYKHMCFMLVGYNTTFEEDMFRFRKLVEKGVDPYVMPYNKNEKGNKRIKHFARWVNARIYKKCDFDEYKPWAKEKKRIKLF